MNAGVNVHLGLDLLIAFIIVLFRTGVFAFVGFAYPTNKLIGSSCYHFKNTNQLLFWYRLLKVGYFKKLLLLLFWGSKKTEQSILTEPERELKFYLSNTSI
ncbi:MAG: hypothetical protein ACI91R_000639 [Vicingaceae bacterium]